MNKVLRLEVNEDTSQERRGAAEGTPQFIDEMAIPSFGGS